eukprot:544035-Prorocentrum_minimum.AAC.1
MTLITMSKVTCTPSTRRRRVAARPPGPPGPSCSAAAAAAAPPPGSPRDSLPSPRSSCLGSADGCSPRHRGDWSSAGPPA